MSQSKSSKINVYSLRFQKKSYFHRNPNQELLPTQSNVSFEFETRFIQGWESYGYIWDDGGGCSRQNMMVRTSH